MFEATKEIETIVSWLQNELKEFNKTKVVIPVSGGAESAVCAAICEKAFGRENARILTAPFGLDKEYADSTTVMSTCHLNRDTINIWSLANKVIEYYHADKPAHRWPVDKETLVRYMRMATVHGIAMSQNALVIMPTTLSKAYLLGIDLCNPANECYPFLMYTRGEVIQMGAELGIPEYILLKNNQEFEKKFQITFGILDDYLRGIPTVSEKGEKRILELHNNTVLSMCSYTPNFCPYDVENGKRLFEYT